MVLINRSRSRSGIPSQAVRAAQAPANLFDQRTRSRRRPAELLDAIQQLDVTTDDAARRELLKFVGELYEQFGGTPLGLFAKCWLGAPYLDHIVSLGGSIVRHFKETETVPEAYAPARPLARNSAYRFIEVHSDGSVIPIRTNGTPVI